jgi:hypothetical protein
MPHPAQIWSVRRSLLRQLYAGLAQSLAHADSVRSTINRVDKTLEIDLNATVRAPPSSFNEAIAKL